MHTQIRVQCIGKVKARNFRISKSLSPEAVAFFFRKHTSDEFTDRFLTENGLTPGEAVYRLPFAE
jgi:hypothetical protein